MKKSSAWLWCLVLLGGLGVFTFFHQPAIQAANQIKIQFYNDNKSNVVDAISANFKLQNTSSSTIDLSTVKMRYYFTADSAQPLNMITDSASVGSANVTGVFNTISGSLADHYCEVGFTSEAGNIAPGGEVTVQLRIVKQDSGNFIQTNDYSFNFTAWDYADWSQVTGYVAGILEWGTPPATLTPVPGTPTPYPTFPDGFHIATGEAEDVSFNSAVFTAHLNINNQSLEVWFVYWETVDTGVKWTTTPEYYSGVSNPDIIHKTMVSGLKDDTYYAFQAVVRYPAGNQTQFGVLSNFKTLDRINPTATPSPTQSPTPTPTPYTISSMTLEVENCDTLSGVTIINGEVVDCDNEDWICFKNVNFDPFTVPKPSMVATPQFTYTLNAKFYRTYDTVQWVRVRLDSIDSPIRADIKMQSADNYQEHSVTLTQTPPTGTHDLYLQFFGVEDIGCFDYFRMNFKYLTQRGITPTPRRPIPSPTKAPTGPAPEPVQGIMELTAGYSHSFAYRSSNAVMGWGDNSNQQVCSVLNPRIDPHTTSLTGIKGIYAGTRNSAAIKLDGTLWMWGFIGNELSNGQIGFLSRPAPVQISGLTGVVKTAGGRAHQVALKSNGTVWTMWENTYGQLGNGSGGSSLNPVQVAGLSGVTDIASGYDHILALKSDGTVWAWGYNHYGQLGNGITGITQNIPVQVAGLSDIVAIAAGGGHSVALDRYGRVWTWGSNYFGQLGDGTKFRRLTPVQVSGLTGVGAISAGMWHTVALKNDGTVWTWGDRNRGQLGVPGLTENAVAPVQVTTLNGISSVQAGAYFNLALKNDTTVWAWGYNINGQLGNGQSSVQTQPVQSGLLAGTPTPTGTLTPTPTRRPTVTPTPAVPDGYQVSYLIQSDWGAGATIGVTITNKSAAAVNGWTLVFSFPGNQTITNLWNGSYTQSGTSVSVKDGGFNANIPANGGSVNFGFNLNYSGTNTKPTSFTLNGTVCQI